MDVDRRGITRAWKAADRESVQFRLRAQGNQDGLLSRVEAAILAANAQVARDRTDGGTDFACTEPWAAPGGASFLALVADTAPAMEEWIDTFAEVLAAEGVRGRLVAERSDHPEVFSANTVTLSAVLSLEKWVPADIQRSWPGWFEDPRLGERVFDWAVDWVAGDAGSVHLGVGLTMYPRPPEVVRELLPLATRPGSHPRLVVSPALDRVRLVLLDECGRLVVQLRDDARPWRDLVAELQQILVAFADVTQCSLVRWAAVPAARASNVILSRRSPTLPGDDDGHLVADYYSGGRYLDTRHVPDVYGLQVVGQGHLDRMSDLSSWDVAEVAPGRHLVRARDTAPWFGGAGPDPDVVRRARSDFGDVILRGRPARQPARATS